MKYAAIDQEAALLRKSLCKLIGEALRGEITAAPERGRVPGAYWFTEANLAQYADLEEVHYRGDPVTARKLLRAADPIPSTRAATHDPRS